MAAVSELLGESREIEAVRAKVAQLLTRWGDGQRLPPILIEGETGTGKGLLVRALHRQGPRRNGPLVDVNCAAIPETLLEAEMFGFERGAFTDARQAKPGLFEAADRGTLFLDEVGLLAEPLQSKLLQVIEEHSVRRLGSTRSRPIDVWVISASNEDLPAAMRQRRFREDLYHRLAVLTVRLPPLRERGDDAVILADHFLEQVCADYKLAGKTLAPDARAALLNYPWPGNVRELANVIERAALLTESPVITARGLTLPSPPAAHSPTSPDRALKTELGEMERERLLEALELTDWNFSRAATHLRIPRNTLRYRIEKHGLAAGRPPQRVRSPALPVHHPAAPADPVVDADLPRDPRRLAFLRVVLVPAPGGVPAINAARVLDMLAEKIETFEGRVEEAGTSDLVAAFGLEPVEDAASRAAHAAMALRRAIAQDGDQWAVRLAIHAGQFLVTQGRSAPEISPDTKREARLILDALVDRSEPGEIVTSDGAAPFLARRFDLVPLEASDSAGATFRVLGRESAGAAPVRRTATFVGRHHDLELLEEYLASTLRGQGHVVGITGEAGIGKSRLLAEFRERLRREPVTYREGSCLSYGGVIPYLPVLDILRQNCAIGEADSAETMRDKVSRSLAAVSMDKASAPYFLHLLGIREGTETLATLTPEAIKLRTLDALRRMVLNGSRQRPIVFVVEDLHWIDRPSEELFGLLAENLPGAPILFLATYRPGYRPPWLDRSYATQMALPPLSPEDSLAVVHSVLKPDVPGTLTKVILDKADGNPFFLEELCRAVEEQSDLGSVPAVPDTIQDVLLARIRRLPAGARSLLQTAAVLGREVSLRVLDALWDGAESLNATLSALTSLEFLYPRIGDGESAYVFKHALTQEVAYETLEPAQRQAMHAAAGRALERFYAGRLQEVYDRLAHHYARTDETAKAIEYLVRFAEKSANAYAHEEAVTALAEAQKHVERLPAEARDRKALEIALRVPLSLLPLGRINEIYSTLLAQRDRLERLRDPALAARYYFLLARAYMLGDHTLVMETARQAIVEAERCGDSATIGAAYGVQAVACALSGQAMLGIECGRRAVALLEKTTDQWSLCYAYWALGLCSGQTGAFEDGLVAERRALVIAEAIGDQALEASALWAVGVIHAATGEWDEGVAYCQRAVQRARHILYRAIATGFLGFAYMERGDAESAIAALEQSIPLLQQFGLKAFEGWFNAFLAESYRLAGQLDRSEMLAARALEIATGANFPVAMGWAQLSLGRIAAARGDGDAAAARLTEALATFTATHSRYEVARTHVALANLWWARGDRATAHRHLAEAHALFTALGVPRYGERVERLAAGWGTPLTP